MIKNMRRNIYSDGQKIYSQKRIVLEKFIAGMDNIAIGIKDRSIRALKEANFKAHGKWGERR